MAIEYKSRSIEHILSLTYKGNKKVPIDVMNRMMAYISEIAIAPQKRDRLLDIVPRVIQRYERKGYFMDLFKRAYNIYEQVYVKEGEFDGKRMDNEYETTSTPQT